MLEVLRRGFATVCGRADVWAVGGCVGEQSAGIFEFGDVGDSVCVY